MDTGRRVVITGMGMITPLGLDVASTWKGALEGRPSADHITFFDPEPFETKFACEIRSFDPLNYMDRKEARRMDRFTQFAVAATNQALENARLQITTENGEDIGVIIGSGIGGIGTLVSQMQVLQEKGPSRISPFLVPMMIADMASGMVSILTKAKGPNFCTTSACSSGADAIGECYEIIRRGDAKAMLAGGSEAPIVPIAIAGFNSAGALSRFNQDPKKACRPFDAQRDGFVVAEGGVTLILEELFFAQQRGAPILAEITGYGATSDAYHVTAPAEHGEGGARAMKMALRKAGIPPTEVDYINAHGTSTQLNDKFETMAIKTIFGEHAHKVPISSTKSMTGHLLGAAGAIETAFCVLALRDQVIPPTINLEHPDPECDLDYVPNKARPASLRTALTNSFGFGGHNSCLIIRKYEE